MSQVVKITLIRSLAVNSAKNETFLKGTLDKAATDKAITVAYHEQAGDEQYHERMLARAFYTSVEKLKTWFSDYLAGSGSVADNPLVDSDETDEKEILLTVSDRFNTDYVKTLARLSQKYVEDRMVYLWYASIDEKKAAFYAQIADEGLEGIKRCFQKTAPSAPHYNFPTAITLRYPIIPNSNAGSNTQAAMPEYAHPVIIQRGQNTEISYILTGENGQRPIDDIIVKCDNGCCHPYLDEHGNWCIAGDKIGLAVITLFSRHNDQVSASFVLRVTN